MKYATASKGYSLLLIDFLFVLFIPGVLRVALIQDQDPSQGHDQDHVPNPGPHVLEPHAHDHGHEAAPDLVFVPDRDRSHVHAPHDQDHARLSRIRIIVMNHLVLEMMLGKRTMTNFILPMLDRKDINTDV